MKSRTIRCSEEAYWELQSRGVEEGRTTIAILDRLLDVERKARRRKRGPKAKTPSGSKP